MCGCGGLGCRSCRPARPATPYAPRPSAHIWIDRSGVITSVVCSNVPEGQSLPAETPLTVLMFGADWEVIVTDLGARA